VLIAAVKAFLTDWHAQDPTPAASCIITGYSTVVDVGLLHGTRGTYGDLESCKQCNGSVVREARAGHTFTFVRDTVCRPDFPAGPGSHVLFFGGTNDDAMWHPSDEGLLARPRRFMSGTRMLLAAYDSDGHDPAQDRRKQMIEGVAATSAVFGRQAATIRETAACAGKRQAHVDFYQDYIMSDVKYGRSPDRARFAEERRQVVTSAGGHFVDLLSVFGSEAGVTWFNDVIHPSTHIHWKVSEKMCADMERER
jgi:hypothetical protein